MPEARFVIPNNEKSFATAKPAIPDRRNASPVCQSGFLLRCAGERQKVPDAARVCCSFSRLAGEGPTVPDATKVKIVRQLLEDRVEPLFDGRVPVEGAELIGTHSDA